MRITRGMIGQRVYNSTRKVGNQAGSSNTNALLKALNEKFLLGDQSNSTSGSSNKLNSTVAELKKGYTQMQTASKELQASSEKLMEGGEKSLFAKAKESGDTKEVVKEITNFVEAYNEMYAKMESLGGNVNSAYAKQLKKFVTDNKDALKEIGITQAKDGTLTIKEKTLNTAALDKLQELFGNAKSFADKVADKAGNVEGNADANLNAINASGYNSYGSSSGSSSYGNNGNRYSAKG